MSEVRRVLRIAGQLSVAHLEFIGFGWVNPDL